MLFPFSGQHGILEELIAEVFQGDEQEITDGTEESIIVDHDSELIDNAAGQDDKKLQLQGGENVKQDFENIQIVKTEIKSKVESEDEMIENVNVVQQKMKTKNLNSAISTSNSNTETSYPEVDWENEVNSDSRSQNKNDQSKPEKIKDDGSTKTAVSKNSDDTKTFNLEKTSLEFLDEQDANFKAAFEQKDYRKALYHIDQALKIASASQRLKLSRAECLANLGRHKEAQEVANDLLRNDSTNVEAIYIRGLCLYYEDNLDKALSHFQQVLKLAPDFAKAKETFKVSKHFQKIPSN